MTSVSSRSLPLGNRGFSLVEVIITLAIISLLTALVMFRYGAFNSAVLLKNQAFEMALDIRDAQVRAISVRSDTNEFREEYGIYVDTISANQQYVFWQDNGTNVPAVYTASERVGDPITLDNRFFVQTIYVDCSTASYSGCTTADNLSISFARPNFDASLAYYNGSSWETVNTAHIIIEPVNESSTNRAVYITRTGLITVQ